MTFCELCREPCPGHFCADLVSCNHRARLRLGIPRFQANRWKGRDKWRYTKLQGGAK